MMKLALFVLLINGITSLPYQCTTVANVGQYYIDECKLRCECKLLTSTSVRTDCFRERPEYKCMSEDEKQRFHRAYLNVSNPTNPLYQKLRQMILNHSVGFTIVHTVQNFLPWHRAYLAAFEQLLIDGSGDCTISIPWWGYSKYPTNPFSYLPFGESGLGGNGNCVTTGPFATPWIPPGKQSCLVRDFQSFGLPTYTQLNTFMSISAAYSSFSNQTQVGYHNGIHILVGGDASTTTSRFDAICWLLH